MIFWKAFKREEEWKKDSSCRSHSVSLAALPFQGPICYSWDTSPYATRHNGTAMANPYLKAGHG